MRNYRDQPVFSVVGQVVGSGPDLPRGLVAVDVIGVTVAAKIGHSMGVA